MTWISSLLPIAIYILLLKFLDNFSLVSLKKLLAAVAIGVASSTIAAGIAFTTAAYAIPFPAPVIEEALKMSVAYMMIRRGKMVFISEALCYGAAIGAGFAFLENMLYASAMEMSIGTSMFRGMSTALMHIGCTCLETTMMLMAINIRRERESNGWQYYVMMISAFIIPVAIHWVYNMFLMPMPIQMAAVITGFLLTFVVINNYNEKRIYRWLDHSMQYDVQLLAAIRKGKLTDTNTGKYLMSVKDHFQPLIVADMLGYIQLYLELTLEAKSRMMLVEVGLPAEMNEEQQQSWNERVAEMKTLKHNIGLIGEQVLKPIVHLSVADIKILKV